MPDGGDLTIEITNVHFDEAYTSLQGDVAPGDDVVIGVSDTGKGMPADVANARPAIPILQSDRRIDLMMSDVMLTHLNGRKLAEIARASRPYLKVLFLTGYAEDAAVRGDFLDPGMDMLTKPFALDALGAKVPAMIEG